MILFFVFLVTATVYSLLYFVVSRYGIDALREMKRQSDLRAIQIFREKGIFRKKTLDRVEREITGERPDYTDIEADAGSPNKKEL